MAISMDAGGRASEGIASRSLEEIIRALQPYLSYLPARGSHT